MQKLGVWKMKINDQQWHKRGTKKNQSPLEELNPWPPKHRAGALSTELRELMLNFPNYLLSKICFKLVTVQPGLQKDQSQDYRYQNDISKAICHCFPLLALCCVEYLITWNFRDTLISRFWGSNISRHLNFAIFWKFHVLSHFNFAFWVIRDPRDNIFLLDKVL